jgi:16S rRNA U516 pseudouridylate synthase RsuA-like enzyme
MKLGLYHEGKNRVLRRIFGSVGGSDRRVEKLVYKRTF